MFLSLMHGKPVSVRGRSSALGLGWQLSTVWSSAWMAKSALPSELGQGSTFTVTLPLQAITEPEDADCIEHVELPMQTESSAFDLRGKKLLIAEDNEINMEIATEILSMNGVQVVQAWDGQQAVEIFSASQPHEFDAILMDMQMPNMNGCQAAQAIRTLERADAATIPIIAVTANAFPEDIAKTQAAGMNAHIVKPLILQFCVSCCNP